LRIKVGSRVPQAAFFRDCRIVGERLGCPFLFQAEA